MAKRKKHNFLKTVRNIIIFAILMTLTLYFSKDLIYKKMNLNIDKTSYSYIAGNTNEIQIYTMDYKESVKLVRGLKVKAYSNLIERLLEDNTKIEYKKIRYNKIDYLILKDNVVSSYENIALEKEKYVRTSLTVYKDKDTVDIIGNIKKGNKVEILGFDKLKSDGSVNKYKIKYNDNTGYIYSKYLVDDSESALLNYDQNGIYQIHAARPDSLGAGSAKDLDYYPNEKPKFDNNIIPNYSKTIYLNASVINNIDAYIALAKETGVNAFVVDIKEASYSAYPAKVMEEYSPTSFSNTSNTYDAYKAAINKIKENNIYVIGRIVLFKDSQYIKDHPEEAISNTSNNSPYLHNGSYWPTPFSRKVWEYNVKLAIEAVNEMGFNEIQFDYARFPDRIGNIERNGLVNMKNTYGETKSQAIQNFLMYAADELHNVNAYISVDVFGETSNSYVTAYGQYWPAISNVVDVISAMPYPDHFSENQYGLALPWTEPYSLIKAWSREASLRQKEIPNPAIARTWIQAYNAIKPPYNIYGSKQITDQINGLSDGGLLGGFITWNSGSSLEKYRSIAIGW